jgi:hypothetical protein
MKNKKKKSKKRNRLVPVILGGTAVLAVAFAGIFYVPDTNASVTGSVRYTDDQIRKIVFGNSTVAHNSLYLSRVRKTVYPTGIPFIDSVDIEYAGTNKVVLHVNENRPIGYLEQGNKDYYFDADGKILEVQETDTPTTIADESTEAVSAVSSSSFQAVDPEDAEVFAGMSPTLVDLNEDGIPETDANGIWLVDSDGDGKPDMTAGDIPLVDINGDGVPDVTMDEVTQARAQKKQEKEEKAKADREAAEKAAAEERERREQERNALKAEAVNKKDGKSGTSRLDICRPSLSDVLLVTGFPDQKLKPGKKIEAEHRKIFSYIRALSKIVGKFDLKPDYIRVENGREISMFCGDVEIRLGRDDYLEDKIARASAIFPQLAGMKGTLHLESFTEDTVNIVFETDQAKAAKNRKNAEKDAGDKKTEKTGGNAEQEDRTSGLGEENSGENGNGVDTDTGIEDADIQSWTDGTEDASWNESGIEETNENNGTDWSMQEDMSGDVYMFDADGTPVTYDGE